MALYRAFKAFRPEKSKQTLIPALPYDVMNSEEAREAVIRQIDSDSPIPYLMLKHQNKNGHLEDYIWHWFILAGYEETEDDLMVKAVSYGEYKWFSLKELWDTGYDKKGGMILYHIK